MVTENHKGKGTELNYAYLWLVLAAPAVLGEVLTWRQSAPELSDWRNHLNDMC